MEARESQGQSSRAVGTWHRAAFSPVTPPVPSPSHHRLGAGSLRHGTFWTRILRGQERNCDAAKG